MSVANVGMLTLVLVVAAGASGRLTRLITSDVITIPLRKAVIIRARTDGGSRFWSVVEDWQRCPWCAGLWISAGVHLAGAIAYLLGGVWLTVFVFGAAALTANLIWSMIAQHWDSDPVPSGAAEPDRAVGRQPEP